MVLHCGALRSFLLGGLPSSTLFFTASLRSRIAANSDNQASKDSKKNPIIPCCCRLRMYYIIMQRRFPRALRTLRICE